MSDSQTTEKPNEIAANRGWIRYERKTRRSLIPFRKSLGKPLTARACHWLLPWTISDYPGFQRGSVEVLGGKAALETLRAWWKGRVPLAGWAALEMAEAIEARCMAGQALIVELRAYAAERANRRKGGPGFRAIDPVTGLSGRSNVGKRRKVKEV